MHKFNITRAYETEDYAEQLNEWLHSAQLLEAQVQAIHDKGKTFIKICAYLKNKIGNSYMNLPPQQRKDAFSLLRELHRQESLKIYRPNPQPLESHFQIGVVTWLRFCGGDPKVNEVLNIPHDTDLQMFFYLLSVCTYNDHVLYILGETQQTRHSGLMPSDGRWFYQTITNGIPGGMQTLNTEEDYLSFTRTTAALGESQKMRMIHASIHAKLHRMTLICLQEVMTRVPAAIRASRDDDNVTSLSHPPLPPAFQPSLEDEPLEGGIVNALAKSKSVYQAKDDHQFTIQVAEAIGRASNREQIHGEDVVKEALKRKRGMGRTAEGKSKQNSKHGFKRREVKRLKKHYDAEERELSEEEQLPHVEQLSLEEQCAEEAELSSEDQLCDEEQEEQEEQGEQEEQEEQEKHEEQEQSSQNVLPMGTSTLQLPMRLSAIARGKQRALH